MEASTIFFQKAETFSITQKNDDFKGMKEVSLALTEEPGLIERATPRVSVGLPVFNGSSYLSAALDSLLGQTYFEFELIISDNGSTDTTRMICERYAQNDSRIRYYREKRNRGAAWNFNRLVDLARGEFFMWASHDDLWAPHFLEYAVEALDNHPDSILCYSSCEQIDSSGTPIRSIPVHPGLSSPRASTRFATGWRYQPQNIVFGLIRTSTLRKTRRIGAFSSSDKVLVSELMLLGPAKGLDQNLFFYRKHEKQSTGRYFPDGHRRLLWFDPTKTGAKSFPHWRLLKEHMSAVSASEIVISEKIRCYLSVLRKSLRLRRQLMSDLATNWYEPPS